MDPRQNWQTIPRPERADFLQKIVTRCFRYCPDGRVAIANQVLLINFRDAPSVVIDPHSPQFRHRFIDRPAVLRKLLGVRECEQLAVERERKRVGLQLLKDSPA